MYWIFERKNIKIFALFASLILVTLLLFAVTAFAAPTRIGIVGFDSPYRVHVGHGQNYDIGQGALDMLTTQLAKNRSFEVIERAQIKAVLDEQGFDASGAVDSSTAAQMGQILGLKYIVYGKVLSAGAEGHQDQILGLSLHKQAVKVRIAVRMINATTGAIAWADEVEGKIEKGGGFLEGLGGSQTEVTASIYDDALHSAIGQIVSHINQTSPTEGSIAKVNGKKVYLDIGVDQGVTPGQTFTVYREGETITNAAGQVIGVDKNDLCTIKITRVDGGMSIGEVQDKPVPVLLAGDKVRSN